MDFDHLLTSYFGTADIDRLAASALEAGIERMRVDFALEQDSGKRFGLWALLYMLGNAPDLDVAFKDADERDAARNFMDMIDEAGG